MASEWDEDEALRRAVAGDREAFAGLVECHQGRVRLWVAQVIGDREEAYDLAQDIFLAAWRALPRFQVGRRFLPWLRAIARHHIADHLRARYRHGPGRQQLLDEGLAQLAVEDAGENRRLAEELAALRWCVQELPEERRLLLRWRYLGDASMAEIDERLQRSAGYAANLLVRLRRRLAACVRRRLAEVEA